MSVQYGKPLFGTVTEEYPVVETQNGKVAGENRDGVALFRGIPYGGRTDRNRRFQAPKAAKSWKGVRDCTRNAPINIQIGESVVASKNLQFFYSGGHPERFGTEHEPQSENCLYLNVLTPGIDEQKRPVLFYIHGGGYATNSGTIGMGADGLCREQDVVVVSLNHRLHFWGYLYLGDFDEQFRDSGNAGQLDLILALTWVRDNIAAFGGDPDNVTIYGESGGGGKINHLIHMPEAKGLFQKAVSISGSMPVGTLTREQASANAEVFLHKLGVAKQDCAKLLHMPSAQLMAAAMPEGDMFGQSLMSGKKKVDFMSFGPVADGIHMPDYFTSGYEVDGCCKDIPMIIGASEDEMACFVAEVSFDIHAENFREKLLEKGPMFELPLTEENVDEFMDAFENANRKKDTPDATFLKMISLASSLGNGAYKQAYQRAAGGCAPVYLYLNRIDVPHAYLLNRRYAWHTFDLPLQMRIVPFTELEDLSLAMSGMLGAFMRTDNPANGGYTWEPFTTQQKETMVFDDQIYMAEDPMKTEREAMEKILGEK